MRRDGTQGIFVDANVWYPRCLRDWIAMLYLHKPGRPLFDVFWTDDVLSEVLYHLRRNHPDWPGARISGICRLLAETFEVGHVTDFEIDGSYAGPDRFDAHIHAAAVKCQATTLVTSNLEDFPAGDDCPYDVTTPDDFFVLVDDSASRLVEAVGPPETARDMHSRPVGGGIRRRARVCPWRFCNAPRPRHEQHSSR